MWLILNQALCVSWSHQLRNSFIYRQIRDILNALTLKMDYLRVTNVLLHVMHKV